MATMKIKLHKKEGIKLKTKDKYCYDNIDIIPNLEEVEVSPSTEAQNITPNEGFCGLREVKIKPVETEEMTIQENGEYTPSEGKFVRKFIVDVPTQFITQYDGFARYYCYEEINERGFYTLYIEDYNGQDEDSDFMIGITNWEDPLFNIYAIDTIK